jgi:type IV pilus assembly protein PilB
MARKKLGEMLIDAGVLTEQGLRLALNEQRRWGGSLGRSLVEMKLVSEPELVRVLSAQLHLPTIDLEKLEIPPTVLELVPAELAAQHNIVPFAQPMKFLDVAMADPTNLGLLDELRIRTQLNIRPYLAGPKMLERAIARHYGRGFGRTSHRPDVTIAFDGGGDTVSFAGPGATPTAPEAPPVREGLRPYPRPQTRSPGLEIPVSAPPTGPVGPPAHGRSRDAEIDALQDRISALEALVARDEEVLRKLLALLVEKQVATRDEILDRIR